jgi:hypothetical protein
MVVGVAPSTVTASCTTGGYPSASVTGVVVSTSIDPDTGVFVEVSNQDGATRTVVFYGRNPNNKLPDGSENSVEDSWPGELPVVGGRYTIAGAEFQGSDGPLGVNMCADSPSVLLLAASPVTADDVTDPTTAIVSSTRAVNQSSSSGGGSGTAAVAVLIGVVLGVAAILVIVRRRAPTTHT